MNDIQKIIDNKEALAGELQFYKNQYQIIKNNIESFKTTLSQMQIDLSFINQNNQNWYNEFKKFIKNLE